MNFFWKSQKNLFKNTKIKPKGIINPLFVLNSFLQMHNFINLLELRPANYFYSANAARGLWNCLNAARGPVWVWDPCLKWSKFTKINFWCNKLRNTYDLSKETQLKRFCFLFTNDLFCVKYTLRLINVRSVCCCPTFLQMKLTVPLFDLFSTKFISTERTNVLQIMIFGSFASSTS